LSSDDGKGPKLNTLAKHYLPKSSADDCEYMTLNLVYLLMCLCCT